MYETDLLTRIESITILLDKFKKSLVKSLSGRFRTTRTIETNPTEAIYKWQCFKYILANRNKFTTSDKLVGLKHIGRILLEPAFLFPSLTVYI